MQDKLAHIFWKARHLATVHHHHGDHHAEKEIAEVGHQENPDKQPSITKISDPVSVHILTETFYSISQPTKNNDDFSLSDYNVFTVSLDKYYPPPKYC